MSDTLIGAAGVLVSLVFGWLEYKRGDSDIYINVYVGISFPHIKTRLNRGPRVKVAHDIKRK